MKKSYLNRFLFCKVKVVGNLGRRIFFFKRHSITGVITLIAEDYIIIDVNRKVSYLISTSAIELIEQRGYYE